MEESYGLQDYSEGGPVFSRDPVCGMRVEQGREAGRTGYAGQMYYFCSPDCQEKFQEDAGKYIGQPE